MKVDLDEISFRVLLQLYKLSRDHWLYARHNTIKISLRELYKPLKISPVQAAQALRMLESKGLIRVLIERNKSKVIELKGDVV